MQVYHIRYKNSWRLIIQHWWNIYAKSISLWELVYWVIGVQWYRYQLVGAKIYHLKLVGTYFETSKNLVLSTSLMKLCDYTRISKAITWTKVKLSSKAFSGIQLRATSQEVFNNFIRNVFGAYTFKVATSISQGPMSFKLHSIYGLQSTHLSFCFMDFLFRIQAENIIDKNLSYPNNFIVMYVIKLAYIHKTLIYSTLAQCEYGLVMQYGIRNLCHQTMVRIAHRESQVFMTCQKCYLNHFLDISSRTITLNLYPIWIRIENHQLNSPFVN